MPALLEVIALLKVPTETLDIQKLMAVLPWVQYPVSAEEHTYWNDMVGTLWYHLNNGLQIFDDQLLCATYFFNELKFSNIEDFFLSQILMMFDQKLDKRNFSKTSLLISLMYGMYQSKYFQPRHANCENMEPVVRKSFSILISLAYDYAWYTYLVFKTIHSFKRVKGTLSQQYIFNNEYEIKMLNLVNHNWENPVTGIRGYCCTIFHTLLSMREDYYVIVDEVDKFYWNKAKYLMLTQIIIQDSKSMIDLLKDNDWVDGMVTSLYKPGLVSAGADMYFSVLKSLRSDDEWSLLFMEKVITLLTGRNQKGIENFINYWCLSTFKKYPSLAKSIMSELERKGDEGACLYSYLAVMKQGNKQGLLRKEWQNKVFSDFLIQRLDHHSSQIRMLAFDIACTSHGRSLPTKLEYDLIYLYLVNNVNSDSTVLRISMLGCFKQFLIRLHTKLLSDLRDEKDIIVVNDDLRMFCVNIQAFIINSLNFNGNYQRKITTIKICDAFITHLKDRNGVRKNSSVILMTLYSVLKKKKLWTLSHKTFVLKIVSLLQDPAEDVRENVTKLLLTHYITEMKNADLLKSLTEEAFKCLKSKFFFEIFCGQSIMKLLVKGILLPIPKEGIFKTVEEVFLYGCRELNTEYKAKRDITNSIKEGKQLHSFISIINAVLFCCIQKPYELNEIDNIITMELLENLDGISNQFVFEDEPLISSDFSKISDVVEDMIAKSDYNPSEEKDRTQISGMHQIVLNCLWLNVKACCELSSLLIKYHKEDSEFNIQVCSRSLNIITHVLETSRHKGVIESAGAFLGESIKHLSSLPNISELSKLPQSLFERKLNELIVGASRMASVTRRGAGLSIMVHRIVANDMRKGKPLLYHFLTTLLEACNNTADVPSYLAGKSDIDNEKDLPKAIYLHFLTRIVTDSSLSTDTMSFTASLGVLAFSNLTSQYWQIRNAALQLYGALVPKILGQRKSSGAEEETIATVACDELRKHLPELWQYILRELKVPDNKDKIQTHSNLVPILNLLANTAQRYAFSYEIKEQEETFAGLFQSLMSLLNSPIYTVRRLSAKSIYNIFPFKMIYETIKKQVSMPENLLHGSLMVTAIYSKYYAPKGMYKDEFSELNSSFDNIMKSKKHSFISKAIFDDLFYVQEANAAKKIEEIFIELKNNRKNSPGVNLWANSCVRKILQNEEWQNIPEIITILLDQPDMELYCEFVHEKLIKEGSAPNEIFQNISECLFKCPKKFYSKAIWKILYEISLRTQIVVADEDFNSIIQYFQNNNYVVDYNIRFILPFVAFVAHETKDLNFVEKIAYLIFSLIEKDFEMRYIAVLANNQFGKTLSNLNDSTKVIVLQTIVILLQDEDEDIRNECVKFFKPVENHHSSPFICLNKTVNLGFLSTVFEQPKQFIPIFCENLNNILTSYFKKSDANEDNPFAQDSKNIYIEIEVMKLLILKLVEEVKVIQQVCE